VGSPASMRIRNGVQQAAVHLEDTKRALETFVASKDVDALRSLIVECAPLERVLEALARAKEVLSEAEAVEAQAAESGSAEVTFLSPQPDPSPDSELEGQAVG